MPKENNNYVKIFFRFLKEEGIYKPYIENLKNYNRNKRFLNACLKNNGDIEGAISISFLWAKTPQSVIFWQKKHLNLKEWTKDIKKYYAF